MTSFENECGPVGSVLAEVVRALPRDVIAEIEVELSHSLAAPSAAQVREARLGLLISMLLEGTGEVPTVRDYNEARAAANEPDWPAANVLTAAFGGWIRTCTAAMTLAMSVGGRVPEDNRCDPIRPQPPYSRVEGIGALIAFREEFGDLPIIYSSYTEWVRLRRRAARMSGLTPPRLPGDGVIRKLFGGFPEFVAAARREIARREGASR